MTVQHCPGAATPAREREIEFLQAFVEQAKRVPDRTALRDASIRLSYRDLDRESAVLAGRLRALGVGRPTTPDQYDIDNPAPMEASPWVVVVTGRSVDMPLGVLAALRAGGAYVPVDEKAPDDYIAGILDATRAAAVIADAAGAARPVFRRHAKLGRVLTCRDGAGAAPGGGWPSPPRNALAAGIFTSGSTGRPKGVALEHRAINHMLAWQRRRMGGAPGEHAAAFASFGFIASKWEVFWPLASGMTLHILDEDTRRDLFRLERYIAKHGIRYVFMPPEVAEAFSLSCGGNSLTHVRVAGGRLRSCGQVPYVIDYFLGMSENGGSVAHFPIRGAWKGDIPIGVPFDGTTVLLLDDDRRQVAPGETGEMAIAGSSLARGYIGFPEETARRFVANPFATCADDARLFLSGDLARRRGDGLLEHRGRKDDLVKVRGMRVEPRMVEVALASTPGVDECVVLALPSGSGDNVLAAWVSGSGLVPEGLRDALAAKLPEYMVPSRIDILDRLPRNLNGKPDRRRLAREAAAIGARPAGRADASVRLSEWERRVCALYAEALDLGEGGCADPEVNFLELGGNSLRFLTLQMRLKQEWGVEMSFSDLFLHPTPRATARLLENAAAASADSGVGRTPPRTAGEYALLSPEQRQMWLVWRMGGDQSGYIVSSRCLIRGRLDAARLEAALTALTARHDILRSRFVDHGGEPRRVVEKSASFRLAILPRGETAESPVFDLSRPPLFTASLTDGGEGTATLRLAAHHIVADAMSMRILMDETWDLYFARPLAPVVQQHDLPSLDGGREDDGRAAERRWREIFKDGVPVLELAYDYSRPEALSGVFGVSRARFGADASRRVDRLAASAGATRFQAVLAAWALQLASLSAGEKAAVIGVPFAGRDVPEARRCVGMFVRSLPLVFRPRPETTFGAWLVEARAGFLAAWEAQRCSLERLAALLNPPRRPSRTPFFDVMANHIPHSPPPRAGEGVVLDIENGDNARGRFDLVLDVRDGTDGFELALTYSRDLFRPETADAMTEGLAALLLAAVDQPAAALAALSPSIVEQTPAAAPAENGMDGVAYADSADPEAVSALTGIWREVLGVEPEAGEANFLLAGGDSLKAIRVESRLHAADWILPAAQILYAPRFGDMARRMRRGGPNAAECAAPASGAAAAGSEPTHDALDLFTTAWDDDDV